MLRTKIVDTNARYQGVDISRLMQTAGKQIAEKLISQYGKNASYAFICGKGNNGGNGFATAKELLVAGATGDISVYLIGRAKDISANAAEHHWTELKAVSDGKKYPNLSVKQDCYAADIENHKVIVECLVGTGITGKFKQRMVDVIKRVTHFRQQMVAIDVPVPGYTWDLSLSIMYPKTPDAEVIDVGMPAEVEQFVGPGEVQALFSPRRDSYKSQNGKITVFAGQEVGNKGDDDLLKLTISAAAQYAGTIYVYSNSEIGLPKSDLAEITQVADKDLEKALAQSSAILTGNNWSASLIEHALLRELFRKFPDKKYVLTDGSIAEILDVTLPAYQVAILPLRQEMNRLLDTTSKSDNVHLLGKLKRFSVEHQCFIGASGSNQLLFGMNSLSQQTDMRTNSTGTAIMNTRQGNAILAGLLTAVASKNDLWLSLLSTYFWTGIASELANKQQYAASPQQVIDSLAEAWQIVREF